MVASYQHILLKVIVCGDDMVGKTKLCSILYKGEHNENSQYEPTIGLDLMAFKRTLPSGLMAKIHLLDTSGSKQFLSIVKSYFIGCCLAIIVVDSKKRIGEPNIVDRVMNWVKIARDNSSKSHGISKIPIMIVFLEEKNGIRNSEESIIKSDLNKCCKSEGLLFYSTNLSNKQETEVILQNGLTFIDNSFVKHNTSYPGIKYFGLETISENQPLLGKGFKGFNEENHKGCCSIL